MHIFLLRRVRLSAITDTIFIGFDDEKHGGCLIINRNCLPCTSNRDNISGVSAAHLFCFLCSVVFLVFVSFLMPNMKT